MTGATRRDGLLRRFAEQQRELARLQVERDMPAVTELDLTMQQLRTLALVAQAGALTAQRLAEQLRVSAATVSGLVGRLERRGLVRREQSRSDRRAKDVLLTRDGEVLLGRLETAGSEMWSEVVRELTDEEVGQLVTLTERIVGVLRRQSDARRAPGGS